MTSSPKFIVCPRCRGEGTIVNPEIDGNGLTSSDFDEDPDFRENYFSGVYDISCPCCNGQRVTTRKEYNDFIKQDSQRREDRLVYLQESGIYPGHPDYF